jgi:hypothetical protein
MNPNSHARAWFRLAAVYFAVGVTLGVLMGASVTEGRVASAHFWVYNIGVPMLLGALTLKLRGGQAAAPVVGVASIVVGLSVLLFAWLMFTRIGAQSRAAPPANRRPVAT